MQTSFSKGFSDCAPAIVPSVSFLIQDELFAPAPANTVSLRNGPSDARLVVKRDTKTKGDISELRVAVALAEAGYFVSKPLGENQRYDLIADDGERLHRIQVKTGRLRRGVVIFSCASSHAHRGGTTRPYFGQVEYLAVCCPDTKKVYMIPEQEMTASTAHLRLSPTRNNMVKTIRWASRFELP
ncbi:MAG TPA: group I intron-associated PD-(D/E)XK endonuclease [Candidatus Elarobacter sp.]|nr:group I intron-associated PD-(D/E)XK endonuclease [Candidatus Elarobacter sp.]